MKEEPVEERVSSVPDSAGSSTLAEHLLLQQTPVVSAAAAAASLLRQPDGSLLSQATLQAALMASLAAQQAHQLQYQQRLLGSTLALGAHHPLAATPAMLGFQQQQQQQQREALLAWSKLAARQAAFSSDSTSLHTPTSVNGSTTTSNSKLDDSGIQTSPKVDSTSSSSGGSGVAEPTLLGNTFNLLQHHDSVVSNGDAGSQVVSSLGEGSSGGDVTPSPPNISPPTNVTTTRAKSSGKDGSREKVFVCQICNRSFGYKHVLQNHERTHTGEKPFECKECHKRFTRDHHLKTHMRLHTGEKPYHCSHCDRQFVQVANLRRHLRVHTGERPYACELCDSKFSDSNQLKAHMLIHKGEKPFRCEQCFGTFRRRHHLMHHRCTREPSHAALMSGLLGTADEDGELDSESRSDVGRSQRVKGSMKAAAVEADTEVRRETMTDADEFGQDLRRRGRKPKETRRVIRVPEQSSTVTSCYPEQTEPEDLSVHTARRLTVSSGEDDFKKTTISAAEFPLSSQQVSTAMVSSQQC